MPLWAKKTKMDTAHLPTTAEGAPGATAAPIPTHCMSLKDAAATIGVTVGTAVRPRATKSRLIRDSNKTLSCLVGSLVNCHCFIGSIGLICFIGFVG
jgi:hypothetical protein